VDGTTALNELSNQRAAPFRQQPYPLQSVTVENWECVYAQINGERLRKVECLLKSPFEDKKVSGTFPPARSARRPATVAPSRRTAAHWHHTVSKKVPASAKRFLTPLLRHRLVRLTRSCPSSWPKDWSATRPSWKKKPSSCQYRDV
jgi:hypothetical protein